MSKRTVKKNTNKSGKSRNLSGNVLDNAKTSMDSVKPYADRMMKSAKKIDLVQVGTVAAFAVTGYTLWKNREKIRGFFADSEFSEKFSQLTDNVAEKANAVGSLISKNIGMKKGEDLESGARNYRS